MKVLHRSKIAHLIIVTLILASTALVGAGIKTGPPAEAAGWAAFVNVSKDTDPSLAARMAADSSGAAHVIWRGQIAPGIEHIYYATNAGGSWSQPVDLTRWDSSKLMGDIAVDSAGNRYVVFKDYDNGAVKFMKGLPSGSWTNAIDLSPAGHGAYDPSVGVDGQGVVHVSWAQLDEASLTPALQQQLAASAGNPEQLDQLSLIANYYVRYRSSTDSVNWSSPVTVSWADGRPFPVMAVGGDGAVTVAWADGSAGNSDIMARTLLNGTWTSTFNVSASGGRSIKPSIAAGPSGDVHIVWNESPAGTYQVFHRSYSNGQWSNTSVPGSGNVGYLDPNVAVTDDGTVAVVWRLQSGGGAADLQVWGTTGDGSTWASPSQVTSFGREVYTGELDASGNTLHIVVQTPADGDHDIYYSTNELGPPTPPRLDRAMGYDGMVPTGRDTTAFLPVVMRNAYGGWTSGAGIYNSANVSGTVTITYRDAAGGVVSSRSTTLNPHGYWAIYQGDPAQGLPDGFAGSAIVNASVSINAIVNEVRADGSAMSYDAPSVGSTNTYLPTVMNNAYGGWSSGFGIANTSASSGSVIISYRNSSGAEVSHRTVSLGGYGYVGVYQGDPAQGLPDGFAGSALLTSTVPVTVIVNEVNGSDAGSMSYRGLGAGSQSIYLPTVARNAYGGWTTGTGIANTSGSAGSFTISYRNLDGTEAASRTNTLSPYGYVGLYQGDPGQGLPDGFAGSAIISATVPVASIVNEVNSNGNALSYTGALDSGGTVVLPTLEKNAYGGWTSGVSVFSTSAVSTTVGITYYNSDGSQAASDSTQLPANGHWDIYQGDPGNGLPEGFGGAGVITSTGTLMAVVNEVHSQ
ncbi:MAG: hypothetical protein M1358_02210 [Chloroflexi bacterium]|nr:hypothetical protein [Chloroflexota bacterium]